ncbi:MAG TPA: dihydroorotase [Planctomycetota bacterium]|nr:dihydroorotase [Planctomycetota bacterium]
MAERLLIEGGRVVDPARNVDGLLDVVVEDGLVRALAPGMGSSPREYARVIDARGLVVVPGLVDMHVHLREPGNEEEETIASGAAAAVAGGFTSVAAMPNTDPAVDNEAAAEFQVNQGRRAAKARVYPIGAITKARKGEELSEMGGLVRGGAVAFSDDGSPVRNAEVMRRGLLYAKMFDKVVIDHAEDPDLAGKGVMHAGLVSIVLGLAGKSSASEEVMVARDITLAEITGGRLHIAHVSTRGSVELVRRAKNRGIRVTCEATPHHFSLTDEAVRTFDPNFKMNPPLRTSDDVQAIIEGLKDGTIDAIASDHAPHSQEAKSVEFQDAPNGVLGLETNVPVAYTRLVEERGLSLSRLVEVMSWGPAKILGIAAGTLAPGAAADITILDLETPWTVDVQQFRSKSRNCPFHGWPVRGRAVTTLVGGKVVHELARERALAR